MRQSLIKKTELPILIANLAYVVGFGALSVGRKNYEFVIYCAVIIVFLVLVLLTQRRVGFSRPVLWGLTVWGFLHMAGGHVYVRGTRLYEVVLIPLMRAGDVTVFRYDHLVHLFGFGVATLVCWHLLQPHLDRGRHGRAVLLVLVVLMGMGLGALNEVIELIVSLIVPQSGVGGYYNTAFDLLFNMLGAMLAVVWIAEGQRRQVPSSETS